MNDCDKNCEICYSTTCITCSNGYELKGSVCVNNEKMHNQAVQCLPNCEKCQFTILCDKCEDNFYNIIENAMNQCKPCAGSKDRTCTCGTQQIKGCAKCGVNTCVECQSEKYFLQDGLCVPQCASNDECPNGQICNIDPTIVNQCVDCLTGCLKCSSLTQCDLCASGKFSINGTCLDCSMIGKGDSCQCDEKLIPDCMKCGMGGVCAACSGEFILVSGQCIKVACSETVLCETGQFCQIIPNTLNKCVDCGSGCDSCDQTACQSCLSDFKLVDGHCLKNQCDDEIACQAGFFCQDKANVQNTCIDCSLFPDECKKNNNNLIPIIAGVVSGIVVLFIVLIIVIVVIKRRNLSKSPKERELAILKSNQSSSNMTNGSQQYM